MRAIPSTSIRRSGGCTTDGAGSRPGDAEPLGTEALGEAARLRRVELFLVLLVVGSGVGAGSGAAERDAPAEVAVGGVRVPIMQECDAEQYDCALEAAPGDDRPVYWGWQDAKNHYRLDLDPSGAVLTRVLNGQSARLASASLDPAAVRAADKGGTRSLILRRRAHRLSVILDGRILFDCLDATFATGIVAGAGLKLIRFQPAEDASFSDDFMRNQSSVVSEKASGMPS